MNPSQRNELRRALERRRALLVDEIAGERDTVLDEAELADEMRDHAELQEIDAALRRLQDGGYGICAVCGTRIGLQRLRAEPQAARCIDCQRRHEKTYPA
jgi:RNA polymerase-binding transcription factor DksA